MPGLFDAFALAFKDLWWLPTSLALTIAYKLGNMLSLEALRPAICQACRPLQKYRT
jgi:hypothetical protein